MQFITRGSVMWAIDVILDHNSTIGQVTKVKGKVTPKQAYVALRGPGG
jgi:hypothetical protein